MIRARRGKWRIREPYLRMPSQEKALAWYEFARIPGDRAASMEFDRQQRRDPARVPDARTRHTAMLTCDMPSSSARLAVFRFLAARVWNRFSAMGRGAPAGVRSRRGGDGKRRAKSFAD